MRYWFLSYNTRDLQLARRFEAELKRQDPNATIFFAKRSLRSSAIWMPDLAQAITSATGFVLLVGDSDVSDWQLVEYREAFDRFVKDGSFRIFLVLREGQTVPGLPFAKQIQWI